MTADPADVHSGDVAWLSEIPADVEIDIETGDEEAVNRLLRLNRRFLDQIDEADHRLAAEIGRLDEWYEDVTSGAIDRAAQTSRALIQWARASRSDQVKSWKMPYGKISTRAGATSIDVTAADADDLLAAVRDLPEEVQAVLIDHVDPVPGYDVVSRSTIATAIGMGLLGVNSAGEVHHNGAVLEGVTSTTAEASVTIG